MYELCCFLLDSDVIPLVRCICPSSSVIGIVWFRVENSHFVQGVVKAEDRHRHRFPCTVASGNNGREVLRPVSAVIAFSTSLPPSNLAGMSFDTEPAISKELDVIAAESQIS